MSDQLDDGEQDSFISRISSSGSEYLALLNELRGSTEDLEVDGSDELDFIVRSSAQEIAQEAYQELREEVDNPNTIPFDDPRPVLLEAERQFALLRDTLVEEIERIKEKEEGSVTGADIDTMLYIIDKRAGKTGQFTLFGGAQSLVYNTGRKYDWHPYEAELVIKAHEIAARRNNLHRHLLLDKVLVVPNDERIVYGTL